MSSHVTNDKFIHWRNFIENLEDKSRQPLDMKRLSDFLKFPVDSSLNLQEIEQYFQTEFYTHTARLDRSKWHWKDKFIFIWCVVKLHELDGRSSLNPDDQDFERAAAILNMDWKFLRLKWISLLKTKLKESPWTAFEDDLLIDLKRKYSNKKGWTELTLEFNEGNQNKIIRYSKQIRERWNNFLNPEIVRNTWTQEERLKLFKVAAKIGKRWSKIAKHLEGRTENQVKNHFNGTIKALKRIFVTFETNYKVGELFRSRNYESYQLILIF